MENNIGLYYEGATYAREHGELEKFRTHLTVMENFASSMEYEVTHAINGYTFYGDNVVDCLAKQFSLELVSVVIAHMVQNRQFDGRISKAVHYWASYQRLPQSFGNVTHIEDKIHSVYLNDLAEEVMKREQEEF